MDLTRVLVIASSVAPVSKKAGGGVNTCKLGTKFLPGSRAQQEALASSRARAVFVALTESLERIQLSCNSSQRASCQRGCGAFVSNSSFSLDLSLKPKCCVSPPTAQALAQPNALFRQKCLAGLRDGRRCVAVAFPVSREGSVRCLKERKWRRKGRYRKGK